MFLYVSLGLCVWDTQTPKGAIVPSERLQQAKTEIGLRDPHQLWVNWCGVIEMVRDDYIVVSEFEHHPYYLVYFQTNIIGKSMKPIIPTTVG